MVVNFHKHAFAADVVVVVATMDDDVLNRWLRLKADNALEVIFFAGRRCTHRWAATGYTNIFLVFRQWKCESQAPEMVPRVAVLGVLTLCQPARPIARAALVWLIESCVRSGPTAVGENKSGGE